MTLAIHINIIKNESAWENFNFKCFSLIAAQNPAHHFIFIFDSLPHPELYLEPNCTPVICSPRLKNNLLRHYWYNFKIPSLLDRYQADIFITSRNMCSLRTNVPQCMVIEEISLFDKKSAYWKRFLPLFLNVANSIFITNTLVEEDLLIKYGIEQKKITTLYPGIDEGAYSSNEKEEIKNKHTEGKEFFYYELSKEKMPQLIFVLKAFSLFKKWQKSGMQLVICIKETLQPALSSILSNYKYRSEIKIIISIEPEQNILPAAYAAISLTGNIILPSTGLLAMKRGIPVIAIHDKLNGKVFSDAALYVTLNEKDISDKMMLLYKDEHYRKEQILKGIQVTSNYSWAATTSVLWSRLQLITIR